jgi:small subunit ribosomal protein S1
MSADHDTTQPQPAVASPSDSLHQESVMSEYGPPTPSPAESAAPDDAAEEASDSSSEPGRLGPGEPSTEPASATPRPSERIQIGSQREGAPAATPKPQQVTPGAGVEQRPAEQQQKRKSYPPPNIRAQLPPELEQELQDALSGGSVEELMTSSVSATRTEELAPETRVNARVVSLHGEDVFFDIGLPHQGVAQLKQFDEAPEVDAQIDMMVVRYDAEQGIYELSRPSAAISIGNWDEVAEGQVIEVTITGSNKGGLECQVAGIRGFIPMGQISTVRVEHPEEFVGQRLACVITEANRSRKNLVLSHRALMERERKEKREQLLKEIQPGQIREGAVRSLQDFGAFVDLGGVDGLIHVSQISWDRINHPSEVLQVGQAVKVRIEKINPETGKISLVYRDMGENPWQKVPTKYQVGSRVKGTVSKLMQFGAFVKLEPGVEGLIHISELGHSRVFRTSDVLSEGQEVEARVLSVDADAQRISLSLKALLPPPEKPAEKKPEPKAPPEPTPEELKRAAERREKQKTLKGGIGGPSGGEKFGLRW